MGRSTDILEFWFGDISPSAPVPPEAQVQKWFQKNAAFDREITEQFAADFEKAKRGELDAWAASPRDGLALIVLMDQFSRNMFRDQPAAFSADAKALQLCLAGIKRGDDRKLLPIERAFYYLPLEHAEDLAMQQRSVELFAELVNEVGEKDRDLFESFLDYAVKHKVIIERFGRYPHRNRILCRASTPEEEEYLKSPGSSF